MSAWLVSSPIVAGLSPSSTSYFSAPESALDPTLFEGDHLKEWVGREILDLLFRFLSTTYRNPHLWTHTWLAGSGVSYQWSAARDPGDLDTLVGIDYPSFRASNFSYSGLGDTEISQMLNESFPHLNQSNWHGYELTFYTNPGATDITSINPYAAYNLDTDEWTVHPSARPAPFTREWENRAERDEEVAKTHLARYSRALGELQNTSNPAYRRSAELRMNAAVDSAADMFEEIHAGRKVAFSLTGAGYADPRNYRWQAGKRSGAIQALRELKQYRDAVRSQQQVQTYGMTLPDADVLVRRAATYRSVR